MTVYICGECVANCSLADSSTEPDTPVNCPWEGGMASWVVKAPSLIDDLNQRADDMARDEAEAAK